MRRRARAVPATAATLALAAALAPPASRAQETPPPVITQQRGGVYQEPPASVAPIYVPSGPDAAPPPDPARPPPLTLRLTLDVPLRGGGTRPGSGVQGASAASATLRAQLRWLPVPDSWWFGQVIFHRYLQDGRQQPWHPDFTYAFGYDDWRPGSLSLFYANDTGTRLRPGRAAGQHRFNFPEGRWTLAYRFALPAALVPVLLVGDGDQAHCNASAHLMPRYVVAAGGGRGRHKTSLSAGCRYMRPDGWYAEATVFAYPRGEQQQPWDPDFTYGFGYADWRPGAVSLQYNNYSGNRFPGRKRAPGEGTFRSGSFSATWSIQW